MPEVFVAAHHCLPVKKHYPENLAEMARTVIQTTLTESRIDRPDMLIVSNMLSDELEGQKHLGPLIASAAGLSGIESFQVRAAMATGAMALRQAWLALMSSQVDSVLVVGVERMHGSQATPALAKALDKETEIAQNHTMISINAKLMQAYLDTYNVAYEKFANFAINAHRNALDSEHALFKKELSRDSLLDSREIVSPIRLADCSPVCDGAAAILLTNNPDLALQPRIRLLASEVATDQFRFTDRQDPLALQAARESAARAYQSSGLRPEQIDFFEVHDAFSIMACLCLEAAGFAERGQGWQLAEEGDIFLKGKIPIATHGGLKARGHPIGATAIYQAIEITRQLSGQAGANQIQKNTRVGMMQSIGGAGTTLVTNIFGVE